MPRAPDNYEQDVFINCPFDDPYSPLFNAMVFAVHAVGFRPRCALEVSDSAQSRLEIIMNIISECKYSIHDLSRIKLDVKTKLPRFNMPLELGLDLGCRRFGNAYHREKRCLIMDIKPYRYKKFISDISGQEVRSHGGKEREVIRAVYNLLRAGFVDQASVPTKAEIFEQYTTFRRALPALRKKFDKKLQFVDFSSLVAYWLIESNSKKG